MTIVNRSKMVRSLRDAAYKTMKNPVYLTICTTCADTSQAGEAGLGAGAKLLSLMKQQLREIDEPIELQSQRCLMACTEGCVASVSSGGKMQYLLGRLRAEPGVADDILEFLRQYTESETGITDNLSWPPRLAPCFLGRIPPVDPVDARWHDDGCNL